MQGYGFALWFVPMNIGIFKTQHIPHVTLLCKLSKEEALLLYEHLLPKIRNIHISLCAKQITLNENLYELSTVPAESAFAIGVEVERIANQNKRNLIQKLLTNYNFPLDLHMTFKYSGSPIEVSQHEHPKKSLPYRLEVADVRNPYPENWVIITDTVDRL